MKDGVQAQTGDLMAVNNSPMVSYKNTGLELDKTGLRSNEEKGMSV